MKILVLGGTQFVGRHMVEGALARGHEVTLFNRGQRNVELFPDVEKLRGDRDGDLKILEGRRWDRVIDVSGYIPRHVRDSATLLADNVEHYTFISTISVYAEPFRAGMGEEAPLAALTPEHEGTEQVTGETYGALKVLSERAAEQAMPGRVLVVRPGLIVGPYDHTDRFTYWITRVADREHPWMVVPEQPDSVPMQVIDARDLARFTLDRTEARDPERYNATGPDYLLTLGAVIRTAERVTGHTPEYVQVPEARLLEGGVTPWVDLPLWLPTESGDLHRIGVGKAIAAGMRYRPLEETVADIWSWRQRWDEPQRAGWSRERERQLIMDNK